MSRSLLQNRTKKVLGEFIDKEREKAIAENNMEYAEELQRAKRLIMRGAWKTRKVNPYWNFLGQCLKEETPKNGTLADTQNAMRRCALNWKQLSPEDKQKYQEEEQVIVDYS